MFVSIRSETCQRKRRCADREGLDNPRRQNIGRNLTKISPSANEGVYGYEQSLFSLKTIQVSVACTAGGDLLEDHNISLVTERARQARPSSALGLVSTGLRSSGGPCPHWWPDRDDRQGQVILDAGDQVVEGNFHRFGTRESDSIAAEAPAMLHRFRLRQRRKHCGDTHGCGDHRLLSS
jgi:hypothetical protein